MTEERLKLKVEKRGDVSIVKFDGEMDMNTLPQAKVKVNQLVEQGEKYLIFDLLRLQMIDSAGIGFINGMLKRLQKNYRGNLKLLNLSPYIEKIFNLLKLDYFIEIYDDEEEAIKSFISEKGEADAVARWRKIVSLQPDYADARYQLGKVYFQVGDLAAAEEELKVAVELNPNYLEAILLLAKVYIKQGQMDKSEDLIRRALEINPTHFEALLMLGELTGNENYLDEAINEVKKQIVKNSTYPDLHKYLGECYFAKKLFDKALMEFKEAIRLNEGYGEAYYWLGKVYIVKNEYEKASSYLRKSLEFIPENWLLHSEIEEQLSQVEKVLASQTKKN
jgi:anti-anti-sigma factor